MRNQKRRKREKRKREIGNERYAVSHTDNEKNFFIWDKQKNR